MRVLLSSLASFSLALFASVVPAQTSRDTATGVWPFLIGNLDPQIGTVVARASSHDLDSVYVSIYRAEGPSTGTLWVSDSAGSWNPAWGPVRPNGTGVDLVEFIRQAHLANLQVIGVLKCFDDTVQPDNASHRAYLLDIVDYFVDSYDSAGHPIYDLDGLALDYIRYVSSGCSGKNAALVTDLCRDIKAKLGARTLHAYLIANRYTFDGPSYTGAFKPYSQVIAEFRNCYGQDWEQMARYVDVLMPMCYTANGSIYSSYALHQAYVRTAAQYARQAAARYGFTRRVTPVVKTYSSSGETTTPQTIDASITGALLGGADGYQTFRQGTTASSWWPTVASRATPGQDRPVPGVAVTANDGLTVTLDATSSHHGTMPQSSLQVRYDWGNDGRFEVGWRSLAPIGLVATGPGVRDLGVEVRDGNGAVGATVRRVAVPTALRPSLPLVFARSGGTVTLDLTAGAAAAGHAYVVLGSLSGSSPGTPLSGGLQLPLNFDGLTYGLVSALGTPLLPNGAGVLDARGRAGVQFNVPPGVLAPIALRTLTWAAAGMDQQGNLAWTTNAATVFVSL